MGKILAIQISVKEKLRIADDVDTFPGIGQQSVKWCHGVIETSIPHCSEIHGWDC